MSAWWFNAASASEAIFTAIHGIMYRYMYYNTAGLLYIGLHKECVQIDVQRVYIRFNQSNMTLNMYSPRSP